MLIKKNVELVSAAAFVFTCFDFTYITAAIEIGDCIYPVWRKEK